MKKFIPFLAFVFTLSFCGEKDSRSGALESTEKKENLSAPLLVANAYGLEHFQNLSAVDFSFNVDAGNTQVKRLWNWDIENNTASMSSDESSSFIQLDQVMTEEDQPTHRSFINDTYWLFFPFQLAWTEGNYSFYTLSDQVSPLDSVACNSLTITYDKKDGYSPGDVYVLYLNDDLEIIEWNFKRSGIEKNNSYMRWEKPEIINGIKVHKNFTRGDFRLFLDDINFTTKNE